MTHAVGLRAGAQAAAAAQLTRPRAARAAEAKWGWEAKWQRVGTHAGAQGML